MSSRRFLLVFPILLPCPILPGEKEEQQEGWQCALPSPASTDLLISKQLTYSFSLLELRLGLGRVLSMSQAVWAYRCRKSAPVPADIKKKKKSCSVLLVNKLQANCSHCLGNLGLWLGLGCLLIKILGFWCLVALVCLGRGVRCAAAGDDKIKVQHLAVRKKH